MTGSIFLSGGTGHLGTELCACLLERGDAQIYALVRAADEAEAYHRLREAWQHDAALYGALGSRVFPVKGDFTRSDLGLEASAARTLRERVAYVFHAGAEVGFQKSEAELLSVNRDGTRNMLAFAAGLNGLARFVHISTAYVAGRRRGVIREEDPLGTDFSSLYEKSKAEAEALVRGSGLPFVICRPGMIVGDSRTGWARNFNTVYYVLKRVLFDHNADRLKKTRGGIHYERWDYHLDHRGRIGRMLLLHPSPGDQGAGEARAHAQGPEVALLGAGEEPETLNGGTPFSRGKAIPLFQPIRQLPTPRSRVSYETAPQPVYVGPSAVFGHVPEKELRKLVLISGKNDKYTCGVSRDRRRIATSPCGLLAMTNLAWMSFRA